MTALRLHRAVSVLTLLATWSCAGAEETEVVAPNPAQAPAPATQPVPAAPAAVAPAITPTPTPTPIDPDAGAIAKDAPTFDLIATNDAENTHYSLLRATDGQVFVASGPALVRLSPDGGHTTDPQWARGISDIGEEFDAIEAGMYWWTADAIGGTWPDGAYLVLSPEFGSRGADTPNELYRRTNAMWTRVPTRTARFDWAPIAFGRWKDGSLLALKGFEPRFRVRDDESGPTATEEKAFAAAIAPQKRLVVLRGRPKAPAFGKQDIRAFASLASGQIYAAVAKGDDVTMLHYDDATAVVRDVPLPTPVASWDLDLEATASDRVWLFGQHRDAESRRGLVARFDGAAWHDVETPCVDAARSGSIDDTGAAYFVCDVKSGDSSRAALLRAKAGVVEELQTGITPFAVVANSPTDIWVLSPPYNGATKLVHTGTTASEPFTLPTTIDAAVAVFEWAELRPVKRGCTAPWIPLAEGADRSAAEAIVDELSGTAGYPEVIEARVHGRVEIGVAIRGVDGDESVRATKRVVAKLGAAAGTPTCNRRPVVDAK